MNRFPFIGVLCAVTVIGGLCLTRVEAKETPATAMELAQQALQALKSNEVGKAARLADQALRQAPEEAMVLELAAIIAERQHQEATAQRYWERALRIDPHNERLLREQAGFACRNHGAKEGEHAFRVLAETYPERAAASWLSAAQCAEMAQDWIVANVDYQRLLEVLPNDVDALLALGRIAYQRGQFETAAKHLNQLLNTAETPNEEALVLMIKTQKALNHPVMVVRFEGDLMRLFPESKALRDLGSEGHSP